MSALSQNVRPMPRSLSYFVSRLQGFRRQTVRILAQGIQSGITPSTSIRVVLPSNSLIDLETFGIFFDLVAPANNTMPANIDTALVQSLQLEVGGVQIANIANYNQLMQSLWSWTSGADCRARRTWNQSGNGATIVGATRKIAMQNFLPLTFKPSVIDTGLTGDIVLTLNLASANIGASTAANRLAWTLNNLYASVDVISFVDDAYSRMLREAVLGGVVLELPFTNAQGYLQLVSSMNQSTRFVTSSSSVDMLVATVVNADFDTNINDATIYSTDLPYYFKKEGDNVTDWQYTINGTAVPAFSVLKDYTVAYNSIALGQSYDLLGGHAITTSTNLDQHFCAFLKLNASLGADEGGRYLSGLDTRLTNAQFEFKTSGTAIGGSGGIVMVWTVFSSVLRVGANKQVEYLQ
jgi:hypothetical protein